MKKLILCVYCATLSNGTVHALKFRNDTKDENAYVSIALDKFSDINIIKIKSGSTLNLNNVNIKSLSWGYVKGSPQSRPCPISSGLKLSDKATFVLFPDEKGVFRCKVE